jgi:hypothetical protein
MNKRILGSLRNKLNKPQVVSQPIAKYPGSENKDPKNPNLPTAIPRARRRGPRAPSAPRGRRARGGFF